MFSRPDTHQTPADWNTEALHWGGALSVIRGIKNGVFFRTPTLSANGAIYFFRHHLGDELGDRALRLFQWALDVYGRDPNGKIAGSPPCPDAEVASLLRDVNGNYYLPTLCVDADGLVGSWFPNGDGREEVALLLNLIRCAQMLYACDNSPIELKVSTRRKQKEEQALLPWPAAIVEDSGWTTVQKGNCYREFYRTIKFERVLTPEEETAFQKKLCATEQSPGVYDPAISSQDHQTFNLQTALDSSD